MFLNKYILENITPDGFHHHPKLTTILHNAELVLKGCRSARVIQDPCSTYHFPRLINQPVRGFPSSLSDVFEGPPLANWPNIHPSISIQRELWQGFGNQNSWFGMSKGIHGLNTYLSSTHETTYWIHILGSSLALLSRGYGFGSSIATPNFLFGRHDPNRPRPRPRLERRRLFQLPVQRVAINESWQKGIAWVTSSYSISTSNNLQLIPGFYFLPCQSLAINVIELLKVFCG